MATAAPAVTVRFWCLAVAWAHGGTSFVRSELIRRQGNFLTTKAEARELAIHNTPNLLA